MNKLIDLIIKLGSIDRKIIFLLVAISVLLPLLVTVDTPVRVTNYTQAVFDTIENLPKN